MDIDAVVIGITVTTGILIFAIWGVIEAYISRYEKTGLSAAERRHYRKMRNRREQPEYVYSWEEVEV